MTTAADGPGMAPKPFWDLIAFSSRPTQDAQRRALQAELEKLEKDEIVAFDVGLWHLLGQANRVDLWAAAYLIRGGCSDDSFLYFRCWLVSRGKQVFEEALTDPDSLVGVVDPTGRYNFELILEAPSQAWENRAIETDTYDRDYHDAYQEAERSPYPALQGEDFDFDDPAEMRRRFPRLAEVHLGR
jgi:hypothetical protein